MILQVVEEVSQISYFDSSWESKVHPPKLPPQ